MVITYRSGNASDGSTATLTECQSMIVALIGEGLTKQEIIGWIADSVSYTHLTLPTIYSV